MLRSIPNKELGIIVMLASILIFFILPFITNKMQVIFHKAKLIVSKPMKLLSFLQKGQSQGIIDQKEPLAV